MWNIQEQITQSNKGYVRMKIGLMNQILTERKFRRELEKYANIARANPEKETQSEGLKVFLQNNGYSAEFFQDIMQLDFGQLEGSKITNFIPGEQDLQHLDGSNFNW